ncbi:MAG TPA: hypothetical protein VEA19_06485, partial [Actinomycetota bacterium]|nr:hypothetical protein [Actinomycetota bacterium]
MRLIGFLVALTATAPPAGAQVTEPIVPTWVSVWASRPERDLEPDGYQQNPAISGDGRIVAFDSTSTNLIADQPEAMDRNIFVFDRSDLTLELV